MKDTLIKIPRSFRVERSVETAIARLTEKQHLIGEPDFVPYYDENKKVNAIFSIGVKNGNGNDSYKIISVRECNWIWDILTETPEEPDPNKTYILEESGNYFLLQGQIKTPLSKYSGTWFLNIQDECYYIAGTNGKLRNISDFNTQERIDSLINLKTSEFVYSDFNEADPNSKKYILNKPTSFSDFKDDITLEIVKTDINTYRLRKNGENCGEAIVIPETSYLISCELKDKSLVFNVKTPDTIESFSIDISDLSNTVYKSGRGISVEDSVISVNVVRKETGLDIDEETGSLVYLPIDTDNCFPGAMTPEDKEILDSIDETEFARKDQDLEFKISEKSEGLEASQTRAAVYNTDPFLFRESGGNLDIESDYATLRYLSGGIQEPFNPSYLKSVGNNSANPSNIIGNKKVGPNGTLINDSNFSIIWFPVIKGELSASIFDIKNNGYAINPYNGLGLVGFTQTNPVERISSITLLQGISTPFSSVKNHYLPPQSGWLLVSVKKDSISKVCARLSWTGIKDDVFEEYTENLLPLVKPEENTWGAIGTIRNENEYIGDNWTMTGNNTLEFSQYYSRVQITNDSWTSIWAGGEDPIELEATFWGTGTEVQILSSSCSLPDRIYIDGAQIPPTYYYTLAADQTHTVIYEYDTPLTQLYGNMFSNLPSLTSINVPRGIKSIGSSCFKGSTKLKEVILPGSIETIGNQAFIDTFDTIRITCLSPQPPVLMGNQTFPKNTTFIVNRLSLISYLNTSGWAGFSYERIESITYAYISESIKDADINVYSNYNFGLGDNIRITNELGYPLLQYITIDPSSVPPTGYYYYLLQNRIVFNTGVSDKYLVSDYGTEQFLGTSTLPYMIDVEYRPGLYDTLRHFRRDLDNIITPDKISDTIETDGVVQNKVIKNYIDTTISSSKLSGIIDLSRRDIFSNILSSTNTANSYVVKKPGIYKIPLVYGNAIKNGKPNIPAYSCIPDKDTCEFLNILEQPIINPYIEADLHDYIRDIKKIEPALVWSTSEIIDPNTLYIEKGTPCSYLVFTVTGLNGNAVVCIKSSTMDIIWSWHIWATDDDLTPIDIWNNIPSGNYTSGTKYTVLPVNLGNYYDINGNSLSIHYQWGRKDPFPASGVIGGNTEIDNQYNWFTHNSYASDFGKTISTSYAFYLMNQTTNTWNPKNVSFCNYWNANQENLFDNFDGNSIKSIYDPCPFGFKVPGGGCFRGFTVSQTSSSDPTEFNVLGTFDLGWKFKAFGEDTEGVYFPTTGLRNPVSGDLEVSSGTPNEHGLSWTCTSVEADDTTAFALSFSENHVYPCDIYNKTNGLPIRPVKE